MVAIINYGLGNIYAFANIYKKLNVDFIIAKKTDLDKAKNILLPGVGAFDTAINLFNESGMRSKVDSLVLDSNIPVLGICVGMQIMANSSEEGKLPGLGYVDSNVKKLKSDNSNFILPHMGWNDVSFKTEDRLFDGIPQCSKFYFLHSFFFKCRDEMNSIARTNYFFEFTTIFKRDNIYGVQFHPEKSHINGSRLLKNFALI